MNVYEIVTERIIKSLESGTVPWHKPWNTESNIPRNLKTLKPYRGINVWLLMAGYESPYFLTFNQAKALGGHVKSGEKGLPVVFWKFGSKEVQTENGTEEKKTAIIRYYTVFNVSQCEGLAVTPVTPTLPESRGIMAADAIVNSWIGKPAIKYEFNQAAYSPAKDEVMMPNANQFHSPEEFYSTLFHELTHSTGHEKRLARNLSDMSKESYSKEELIAEMGAAFLCAHIGITSTFDNSAAYIRGWLKALRDDKKLVITAASQAQKACDMILEVKPE